MKIDLSTTDREIIVDALKVAQREELNGLDWSTDENSEESDRNENIIRTNYLRLIKLISLGK